MEKIQSRIPKKTLTVADMGRLTLDEAREIYQQVHCQLGLEMPGGMEFWSVGQLSTAVIAMLVNKYRVTTPLRHSVLPTSISYVSEKPGHLRSRYLNRSKAGEGILVPEGACCVYCGLRPGDLHIQLRSHYLFGGGEILLRQQGPLACAHVGSGPDDDLRIEMMCCSCHYEFDRGHRLGDRLLRAMYYDSAGLEWHHRNHKKMHLLGEQYGWSGLQAGGTDYLTAWSIAQGTVFDLQAPERLYRHFSWNNRETLEDQRAVAQAALRRLLARRVLMADYQLVPSAQRAGERFAIACD
ncbi:hypothetical protein [Deinococcus sp. Marseille-Q6407]|uniref:hypothetical protein n=1 Tax=Deinococcus sp. Marseille-Q6407 TaxID=2969223 RepID=UPI0021C1E747|nr:hypothetical protein [Deinococcus sp. Marseille-Q6407]